MRRAPYPGRIPTTLGQELTAGTRSVSRSKPGYGICFPHACMGTDLDVAVIGGGISGLSAAWTLAGAGLRVRLFEKRHTVGGRIVSERASGFLMEHGPNALVAPAPGAEQLITGLSLCASRIERGDRVRHRYLVRDGRARALPLDPLRFFGSGFFSLGARLRLLAEPFIAPNPDDETIARFAERRFGSEFLDYVVDPLVGGLYAGDPAGLSVAAVFPQLKRLERDSGSIVGGLLRARLRRGGPSVSDPRRRSLFSFRDGLATLPRALGIALGDSIVTGAGVSALRPARLGFRLRVSGRDVTAASVVIALPAYAAATLLQRLDPQAAHAAAGIAHPPLAVVFLGYPADAFRHPLDGLGVLMPRVERRGVLGMLFSSTLFERRAPDGHVALTAYVGGARQPELANLAPREMAAMVHDEIRSLLGARAAPILSRVRYWRYGLPQPGLDHAQRIARLRTLEASLPGFFVAGNYLNGVSTAACVDEALAVARRVLDQRGRMPARPAGRFACTNSGVTADRPAA